MKERMVIALESIAASLKQMGDAQSRQIEASQKQADKAPQQIKEITDLMQKTFIGGVKHGN